jgi:hypothetical protein
MRKEPLVIGTCMYLLGIWSSLMFDWVTTLVFWGLGTAILAVDMWGGE